MEQENDQSKDKQEQPLRVFAYGSCECDQFDGGEGVSERKKPFELSYFRLNNLKIAQIVCGGMHTVALTSQGLVYTFGCNDSGALGRDSNKIPENTPGLVELPVKVDMISAGDSHSVAANSYHSLVYQWGNFRDTNGNMDKTGEYITQTPKQIEQSCFNKSQLQKVLSGGNHVLILTQDKVLYAWGDPETKVLGRIPGARRKMQQSMRIESINKNVENVWTGAYHAFIKQYRKFRNEKEKIACYYSWGLNNYGQLGIGNSEPTSLPTEILEFRNKNIVQIVGGEHHSVGFAENGQVFSWGRNDDGQLGLGDNWKERCEVQLRKQALHEYEDQKRKQRKPKTPKKLLFANNLVQGDNENSQQYQQQQQQFQQQQQLEQQQQINEQNGNEEVKSQEVDQQEIQNLIQKQDKVEIPYEIESLQNSKIVKILATSHYNYAISSEKDPKLYSWGMGENYQLGTGEDTQTEPEAISNEKFVKDIQVGLISLGGQHVIIAESDQSCQIQQEILINLSEQLKLTVRGRKTHQNKSKSRSRSRSNSKKSNSSEKAKASGKRKPKKDLLDMSNINESLKKIKEESQNQQEND